MVWTCTVLVLYLTSSAKINTVQYIHVCTRTVWQHASAFASMQYANIPNSKITLCGLYLPLHLPVYVPIQVWNVSPPIAISGICLDHAGGGRGGGGGRVFCKLWLPRQLSLLPSPPFWYGGTEGGRVVHQIKLYCTHRENHINLFFVSFCSAAPCRYLTLTVLTYGTFVKEGGQDGYQSIHLDFVHNHQCLGTLKGLIWKNRLQHLRPKKGGVSFDAECTQRRVVALRYSPCDDTPNAETVAITTGCVSLLICKIFFFVSILPPLRYKPIAILYLLLQPGFRIRIRIRIRMDPH